MRFSAVLIGAIPNNYHPLFWQRSPKGARMPKAKSPNLTAPFLEDRSDRQMKQLPADSIAAKFF
jgi:hypothetical protein